MHTGDPLAWNCLIQRIDAWSGFLAMWAGIAKPEEAKRMVEENYRNTKTFNSPAGVRSLSKFEKMYARKITKEEQEMIKLAYKMGRTNQFLKD